MDGFNIDAGVVIAASDRRGLERICRYLARPPLGRERLERTDSGDLFIRFKRAGSDGTTGLVLSTRPDLDGEAQPRAPARPDQALTRPSRAERVGHM